MKNWKALVAGSFLFISIGGPACAEEIVIKTKPAGGGRWVSGAKESNGQTPLEVDAKKGDVLVIQLPAAPIHGFVTIDKAPWKGGSEVSDVQEKKDLVIVCGQAESKAAVFQQIDCSEQSAKFGETSKGTLRLQVRDNFAGDVIFWCTAHFQMMWGIIRPKS